MKIIAHIRHWFKQLVYGASFTNWLPGEPPPHPWTKEALRIAIRALREGV